MGIEEWTTPNIYDTNTTNADMFAALFPNPAAHGDSLTLVFGPSGSGKTHTLLSEPDDPGLVFALLKAHIRARKRVALQMAFVNDKYMDDLLLVVGQGRNIAHIHKTRAPRNWNPDDWRQVVRKVQSASPSTHRVLPRTPLTPKFHGSYRPFSLTPQASPSAIPPSQVSTPASELKGSKKAKAALERLTRVTLFDPDADAAQGQVEAYTAGVALISHLLAWRPTLPTYANPSGSSRVHLVLLLVSVSLY